MVRVSVTLNDEARAKASSGEAVDLAAILVQETGKQPLRVFGRGKFASIETTPQELAVLRNRLGHIFLFTQVPAAEPF